MGMNRAGQLIASCCGAAIVVAAAGIVIVGAGHRQSSRVVPAKLGAGGTADVTGAPSPIGAAPVAGGTTSAVSGPVTIPGPGETGRVPGSVTESLVLQKNETFYGKGEAFFRDGDFAPASRYLQAEVGRHPDRFYPTYLLGISLWKGGALDEAIDSLTRAASLDPKSVKTRVNLGRVLNDAGRHEDALKTADEAIALDADDSAARNVRGRALLNLGRKDEAIEAFKTAVEKEPGSAWAQNNLGFALIQAGRFSDAVPYLEEAVRLKPVVGTFQNNLGMAYERTGQRDRAIDSYRAAVKAGGSDAAGRNLSRLGGTVDDETVEPTTADPRQGTTIAPAGPEQN
ncbi:MAG: hypothetical protein AUG09_02275 [Acidobacteria bacterium 13_1_20CM_2_68_7]|nr:MAG: hypothetical protein AUG09_02275 [Acidobacteria bacterium 13_1_20CM_2_68_7]